MLVSRIETIIKNGNNIFPLTNAYKKKSRFYDDFMDMIRTFEKHLSDKEQDSIYLKIRNAYSNDNYQVYLQCNCELVVLYYILRKYNTVFQYEPQYNGNYNPECAFGYNNKVVNIEVKTPDYSKRIEQENNNKINIILPERIPLKKCNNPIDKYRNNKKNG